MIYCCQADVTRRREEHRSQAARDRGVISFGKVSDTGQSHDVNEQLSDFCLQGRETDPGDTDHIHDGAGLGQPLEETPEHLPVLGLCL